MAAATPAAPTANRALQLCVKTPLVFSPSLRVYLKMESTQPSGSFKIRGIGHIASKLASEAASKGIQAHLVSSSGGNAGLAATHAARALGLGCTIFVPVTAKPHVLDKLRADGGKVVVGGNHWAEADAAAREFVEKTEGAIYIHPFDHPLVFEGHSGMMSEVIEQMAELQAGKPAAVVCSVGGGGLISGVFTGLKAVAPDVHVVACETNGAASFLASLRSSHSSDPPSVKLARLDKIDSIASTLGAVQVAETSVKLALEHRGGVSSVTMSDAKAIDAAKQFQPCAAALVPLYSPSTLRTLFPSLSFVPNSPPAADSPAIVVIVCGGSTMTLEDFVGYEREFERVERGEVRVFRGGRERVDEEVGA
ncbi:L-serine dehydratase [Rhodotorula toruloides]|uniref:L-serine ammonia-lyase n=1 Tax=Rhodotorula toruloides TaxID=5286 RepID=A0A511KE54_RHOTO|nr:L-serine dehydratase [Rhodotorula toruloides]